MSQAWQVRCTKCGELRWPYLPEKPTSYTCTRCASGAGEAKRVAGRIRRPKGSPALGDTR